MVRVVIYICSGYGYTDGWIKRWGNFKGFEDWKIFENERIEIEERCDWVFSLLYFLGGISVLNKIPNDILVMKKILVGFNLILLCPEKI